MSIIDSSAGGIASLGIAFAANAVGSFLGGGGVIRKIGTIQAPCTIFEHHDDHLQITDHPVELGAQISDHAYKLPKRVDIEIGWDKLDIQARSMTYEQIIKLQESVTPMSIVTGKRIYKNMLIESVGVVTDADSENILRVNLGCREVIIVQTQITNMAPAANQANPQATAAPQNSGTVQTAPATNVPTGGALPVGTSNSDIYVKVSFPGP